MTPERLTTAELTIHITATLLYTVQAAEGRVGHCCWRKQSAICTADQTTRMTHTHVTVQPRSPNLGWRFTYSKPLLYSVQVCPALSSSSQPHVKRARNPNCHYMSWKQMAAVLVTLAAWTSDSIVNIGEHFLCTNGRLKDMLLDINFC